jgi:transglutaminase-like putative cysteine protease
LAGVATGQGLIKNGGFDVDAAGWINQVRNEPGVLSEWAPKQGRNGSGGVHIRSEKGGEQSIWIWRYVIKQFPADRSLRVSGWVKGKGVEQLAAICVQGWDADGKDMVDFATTQSSKPLNGDFDWTQIETVLTPSARTRKVHVLIFITGKGEVWFDGISAISVDKVPGSEQLVKDAAPGLFEARGAYKIQAHRKSDKVMMLIPLPLCYREQAPLTYDLFTDPPEKLARARVFRDKLDNYVAEVSLYELNPGDAVRLTWSSIVLCGPASFDDAPKTAPLSKEWPKEARPWLASTRCVQATHERIKKAAAEIRGESSDVMEIIRATLKRTGEIFAKQTGHCTDLDAVQALDRKGSCTSNANLVAALLRANGIPARILAGYPTWTGRPLQTHYIVEAYVPVYGWYPIESTVLKAPWPRWKQIEVSIIPPEYEDRSQGRPFAAAGVPYLSLTEYPDHDGSFMSTGALIEEQSCDHEAKLVRPFAKDSPESEWKLAMKRAKSHWEKWLSSSPVMNGQRHLATSPQPKAITASSPAELARLLSQ